MGSAFHCNHIKPDGLAIHNNRELPDFRNLHWGNTQLHSNYLDHHYCLQDRPLEPGVKLHDVQTYHIDGYIRPGAS